MAGETKFQNVKVHRETYVKMLDLQEEISRKRGYKISLAELLTAAVNFIDRLESMQDEYDVASFRGESLGK